MKAFAVATLILATAAPALPCSSNSRRAVVDGTVHYVHGQNQDGGVNRFSGYWVNNKAGVLKRNATLQELTTNTVDPTAIRRYWISKYGSMSEAMSGRDLVIGGVNNQGLVISTSDGKQSAHGGYALDCEGSDDPNDCPLISMQTFTQYLLDTCATLDDVEAAADDFLPTGSGNQHLVTDASGHSLLLEFIDGVRVIHRTDDASRLLAHRVIANRPYDTDFPEVTSLETRLSQTYPYDPTSSSNAWESSRRGVRAAYWHDLYSADPMAACDGCDIAQWTWAVTESIRGGSVNNLSVLFLPTAAHPAVVWTSENIIGNTAASPYYFFYPHDNFSSDCSTPVVGRDWGEVAAAGESDMTDGFVELTYEHNLYMAASFLAVYAGLDLTDPEIETAAYGAAAYSYLHTSNGCAVVPQSCGNGVCDREARRFENHVLCPQDCAGDCRSIPEACSAGTACDPLDGTCAPIEVVTPTASQAVSRPVETRSLEAGEVDTPKLSSFGRQARPLRPAMEIRRAATATP